jgi:hypothetical protein
MAGSAGDGKQVDAQAFVDQKPHYTGIAASGRRDRRAVRPWLLARLTPQWVGGGIDRDQADHLGGDNLTQKPTSPNHQQPLTAFETYNGRCAFAAGTVLHAPFRPLTDAARSGSSECKMVIPDLPGR